MIDYVGLKIHTQPLAKCTHRNNIFFWDQFEKIGLRKCEFRYVNFEKNEIFKKRNFEESAKIAGFPHWEKNPNLTKNSIF